MTQILMNPSGASWPYMSNEANDAEMYVASWFETRLNASEELRDWEMYIRPYFGGGSPSLVLLHPQRGIAVYEVVDWEPGSVRCVKARGLDDDCVLEVAGRRLEGLENPYLSACHHKDKIARLSTDIIGPSAYGLITAGVIFTNGSTEDWNDLLAPFRRGGESKSSNPVIGADILSKPNLQRVLPRAFRNTAQSSMNTMVANLLRVWLNPPDLAHYDDDPLVLDASQSALVYSEPGPSGYRRVKGSAGSGKSVVLATRAAVLAAQGKRVLLTCFNITLTTYLTGLVDERLFYLVRDDAVVDALRRLVTVSHYHEWEADHSCRNCLDTGVCECPQREKFNAIMVDEGQDFEPEWWSHLRLCARADGAEVLFAADATQDLYGRAKSWTDTVMRNSGFRGPWNTLDYNYRVPMGLVPALRDFANNFLPDRVADLPGVVQGELSDQYPVGLRWVQLPQGSRWGNVCRRELHRVFDTLPNGHSSFDMALLFWNHRDGFSFVSAVAPEFSDEMAHIFVEPCEDHGCDLDDKDKPHNRDACIQRRSRTLKLAFPKFADGFRAITTHSYKGWESRHLVIYVEDISSNGDGWNGAALFYVALTRLMRDARGSSLTVVSACPELAAFGRRNFADFESVGHS